MSRSKKIWLFAATALILLGIVLFTIAMTLNHWDFSKLSTVTYETNTTTISNEFCNIYIQTETTDIIFALSNDDVCKVVCYEEENNIHSVTIQNDTLTIQSNKKWYDYIGIGWETSKITVYLPATEYDSLFISENTGDIEIPNDFQFQNITISTSTGDIKNFSSVSENLKIKTSTGDVYIKNISAKTMSISVSTGNVDIISATCEEDLEINVSTGKAKISDISCKNMISTGITGDIALLNLIAEERISINRNTGDVKFDDCDANEIFIKTSTGDVFGSLLSEKLFVTESNTGKITVPKNTIGGRCEITTDTGDIKITIK